MPQPETGYPVYSSDFPPGARVKDIIVGLRARGFVLRCEHGRIYAVRVH